MDNPFMPVLSFLGLGTLLFQIGIGLGLVLFLLTFVLKPKNPLQKFARVIGKHAIPLALLIATLATVSSLFLSEVAGFPPCKLCWYQRVFMYPQVIVLGVAYLFNDAKARISAIVLSSIGVLIAVYHILVQFFPASFQCSDEVANCALKQIEFYGYITIPMMSLTAFLAIILVLLFSFRKLK